MTDTSTGSDRWKNLDFPVPPADAQEPASSVLSEDHDDGRIVVLTLNRPHAGNAITTEMGARLTRGRRRHRRPHDRPRGRPHRRR